MKIKNIIAMMTLSLTVAAVSHAEVIYLTDGDADSLEAFDLSTGAQEVDAEIFHLAYPIAVTDTNSIVIGSYSADGDTVKEYNLSGGLVQNLPAQTTYRYLDGTSDGDRFYGFAYSSSTTVYSHDETWGDAQALFSISGADDDFTGIAYDFASDSLWISDKSTIYNYSLAGSLLGSFSHGLNDRGGLAYSSESDSLWYVSNTSSDALRNFDKSGSLLGTLSTQSQRSDNVWGAEIAVPEPASVAMLAVMSSLGVFIRRWFLA